MSRYMRRFSFAVACNLCTRRLILCNVIVRRYAVPIAPVYLTERVEEACTLIASGNVRSRLPCVLVTGVLSAVMCLSELQRGCNGGIDPFKSHYGPKIYGSNYNRKCLSCHVGLLIRLSFSVRFSSHYTASVGRRCCIYYAFSRSLTPPR